MSESLCGYTTSLGRGREREEKRELCVLYLPQQQPTGEYCPLALLQAGGHVDE